LVAYFERSRKIARLGGIGCGLAGAILGWLGLGGILSDPLLRAAGAGLIALVAVSLATAAARMWATRAYQDLLAQLYMELDPEGFLERAAPLIQIETDPTTRVTTQIHLANGYLALGEFDQALSCLEQLDLPAKALELRGLVMSNQVTCLLQQGRAGAAERKMGQLRALLREKGCPPQFAQKARQALGYQTLCLKILRGEAVEPQVLERDFEVSRNQLHRVSVQLQLARLYQARGDQEGFQRARDYVLEHGKRLYAARAVQALGQ
jgi:hypothetical protein